MVIYKEKLKREAVDYFLKRPWLETAVCAKKYDVDDKTFAKWVWEISGESIDDRRHRWQSSRMNDENGYMNVAEAAQILNVSAHTLKALVVRHDDIPKVKPTGEEAKRYAKNVWLLPVSWVKGKLDELERIRELENDSRYVTFDEAAVMLRGKMQPQSLKMVVWNNPMPGLIKIGRTETSVAYTTYFIPMAWIQSQLS